ncbi:deoxyribodipyrimidine photo-lyase [Balneicella halophila]|uniref:Deoxyribodipyrimidine photo-lyase n=1 Tax=Balneicella halophila TaxID=1537566 RepID=A0A7L4UM63_BALHA|nr:deoxyribodipyrimidine photo-lyase [Balneicella halophila]PVX49212.1 deoxyribodipyrimidine photo-lyase [Balneicella halophila]
MNRLNNNHKEKINIFWFRRDLRLDDNRGLYEALKSPYPVLPLFIFDTDITDELTDDDPRVNFIYKLIHNINNELKAYSSSILCKKGKVITVLKEIIETFDVQQVYCNEDYEPYAIKRDEYVKTTLLVKGISLFRYKDQVIFSKDEIVKQDNLPYTVFTPYKNKWLSTFEGLSVIDYSKVEVNNFVKFKAELPKLHEFGFRTSSKTTRPYSINNLQNYASTRDFPALNQTSNLSVYLRFGAVSIRKIISEIKSNKVFLSELIWREFFMQILYHFPKVIDHNFKPKYDAIQWRNNMQEFEKWKNGETGYPLIDAGMRELNATGYMHNRVRMVVAGFLCKHLLIDWRWGEAYFAEKLMDYELSSNNGNWQWAAGTGCDAAPYFRVFNPTVQAKKFDPENKYIKKWISTKELLNYHKPIVEHKFARERAISRYKKGLLE